MIGSGDGLDRGQGGLALGQRAGLVDHQGIDLLEAFQRLGVLDQDAGLGAPPRAHHDRHRGRQPERAGAGDDQYRDRGDQAEGERRRRPEDGPADKGEHRHGKHRGHEVAGDHIGETLDRRPAALGLRHHVDDLGQHGLVADPFGPHHQAAGAVQGAADQLFAGELLDRDRLAADHRFIDRAQTVQDGPVNRDLFAGPDPEPVAVLHLIQRDLPVIARVVEPPRRLGREI